MFDAISVRDNNSYSIVEKLCGVKSNMNLDPVLVSGIENEPWKEANIENYIIVYGYAGRFAEEEKQAIVEFAHKNKLKTISLCDYQDFVINILYVAQMKFWAILRKRIIL